MKTPPRLTRRQRRALDPKGTTIAEPDQTRRVVATCAACGNRTPIEFGPPPHVGRTGIEHEDACPFWLAIQVDRGAEWVEAHGYPISLALPMGDA